MGDDEEYLLASICLFSVAVKSLVCDRVQVASGKSVAIPQLSAKSVAAAISELSSAEEKPNSFGKNSLAVNQKEKDKF